MRHLITILSSLTLLAAAGGCGPDEYVTGHVTLDFGTSAPWYDGSSGVVDLEDLGNDVDTVIMCSSNPDDSEDGEFNLWVEDEDEDADLTSLTLHLRKMAYTGDGDYSIFHGDDYGFLDLSVTTADGDGWNAPWHDPDGNTCELTISDGGQCGHAECVGMPLNSDDFTEAEDDQPEVRADLVFDWECGLDTWRD